MPAMTNATQDFHDRVTITIADHVAHVLLDRADKMNALDDAMFEAIIAAGHHLHHECEVKACCNPDHLTPLTPEQHRRRHAGLT